MKGGDHTIECESYPRAITFYNLGTQRNKQRFYFAPLQRAWGGCGKDERQGFLLGAVHGLDAITY